MDNQRTNRTNGVLTCEIFFSMLLCHSYCALQSTIMALARGRNIHTGKADWRCFTPSWLLAISGRDSARRPKINQIPPLRLPVPILKHVHAAKCGKSRLPGASGVPKFVWFWNSSRAKGRPSGTGSRPTRSPRARCATGYFSLTNCQRTGCKAACGMQCNSIVCRFLRTHIAPQAADSTALDDAIARPASLIFFPSVLAVPPLVELFQPQQPCDR
jgi:hypothetical protein